MNERSRIDVADGPDAMFSDSLAPSRGQYKTIAVLACQLLGIDPPAHRLDGSIIIARLRSAQLDPEITKSIEAVKEAW